MYNNDINIKEFIKDRESDINSLENAINSSKKKTMLFQRLPFFKRRRTRAKLKLKITKTRHKNRHFLKTHVYYAKRFKMIKMQGVGIPLKRNQKSDSYIYKSQNKGFIFDESFKKILVFDLKDSCVENYAIDKNVIDEIQVVRSNEGFIECVLTKKYFIMILTKDYSCNYNPLFVLENCFTLIKNDNIDVSIFVKDIDLSIENKETFFVANNNKYESGKLFVCSQNTLNAFFYLIKKGFIPVGIEDLQRLALENNYMISFDDVNSECFRQYENELNRQYIDKYNRTPKSKKVCIDFEHLKIQTTDYVKYYIFQTEKGTLKKNALVYDGNKKIIGRVIRGNFCYSKGKSCGLCYFFDSVDIGTIFNARNFDQKNFYTLIVIERL